MWYINLFHAVFVAPMLAYIAYLNHDGRTLSKNAAMILGALALIVFLAHAGMAFRKMTT